MDAKLMAELLVHLTRQAQRFTLEPNALLERDARHLIAGLNLLNGREEDAVRAYLTPVTEL